MLILVCNTSLACKANRTDEHICKSVPEHLPCQLALPLACTLAWKPTLASSRPAIFTSTLADVQKGSLEKKHVLTCAHKHLPCHRSKTDISLKNFSLCNCDAVTPSAETTWREPNLNCDVRLCHLSGMNPRSKRKTYPSASTHEL